MMLDFIKKILKISFVKYLVVGGSSFVLDYAIFYSLYSFAGFRASYANAVSVFLAFIYNFSLNRLWSFESKEPIMKQLVLYLGLMFFNMAFSSGFIYFTAKYIFLDPKIAKIIAMCIIVIWNFFLYKKVIFKNNKIK